MSSLARIRSMYQAKRRKRPRRDERRSGRVVSREDWTDQTGRDATSVIRRSTGRFRASLLFPLNSDASFGVVSRGGASLALPALVFPISTLFDADDPGKKNNSHPPVFGIHARSTWAAYYCHGSVTRPPRRGTWFAVVVIRRATTWDLVRVPVYACCRVRDGMSPAVQARC